MKQIITTGRFFYAIAMVVYGIQQFVYGNFRNVQLPAWQFHIPGLAIWAYITGLGFIAAGAAIIFEKKAKETFLILGSVFFALVCFVHVPYELISEPNKPYHLGLWTSALKELALAGGAFVMAGSFPEGGTIAKNKSSIFNLFKKFIPYGSIFFSITMTSFGIAHFMYVNNVATMVPAWVPDHIFWTYFAGVALIGSGVFIILNIRRKVIAVLLATMMFLWFIFLHIPGAIANPAVARGNEISSAFDALVFSGIALVIAFGMRQQEFDKIN